MVKTQVHLDFEDYVKNTLHGHSMRFDIVQTTNGLIVYDNRDLDILFMGWCGALNYYDRRQNGRD